MIRPTPRRFLTAMIAVAALMLGLALTSTASAAPAALHATTHSKPKFKGDQAAQLQRKIDTYLDEHPGARQVTIEIPGGQMTMSVSGDEDASLLLACSYKWLCIQDGRGINYSYFNCGLYSFPGVGTGPFNNNQTPGTVARFLGSNSSDQLFTSTAPGQGTANWTPVYYIRPC